MVGGGVVGGGVVGASVVVDAIVVGAGVVVVGIVAEVVVVARVVAATDADGASAEPGPAQAVATMASAASIVPMRRIPPFCQRGPTSSGARHGRTREMWNDGGREDRAMTATMAADWTITRVALSRREHEVWALMAAGRSNVAIADELRVTAGAVEKHVANIFDKLGLLPSPDANRRVLAVLAYLGARRSPVETASISR